jgi:hypothetical protein
MSFHPGNTGPRLVFEYPADSLAAAVSALNLENLHSSWRSLFVRDDYPANDPGVLARFQTTYELSSAAKLTGFRLSGEFAGQAEVWARAIKQALDNAEGPARTSLLAYLSIIAFRSASQSGLELLFFSFAELRRAARANDLNYDARRMLEANLPDIGYSNWDIDRRLLIALGKLLRSTGQSFDAVNRLPLTDSDIRIPGSPRQGGSTLR